MRKVVGWLLVLPFLGALFIAWLIFVRMGEGGVAPSEWDQLVRQLVIALCVAGVILWIVITLLRGDPRPAWNVAKPEALAESEATPKTSYAQWILQHPEHDFDFKTAHTSQNRLAFRNLSQRGIVIANQPKRIGQSTFTKTWQLGGIAHNNALPNYTNDLLHRQSHLGVSVDVMRRGGSRAQTAAKATFNVATVRSVKRGGGDHLSLPSQSNHLTGSRTGSGLWNLAKTLQAIPKISSDYCIEVGHWLDTNSPNSALWRARSLAYFDDCMS